MFAIQRRGNAGLGSIGAVGLVLVAWLVATGVLVKSYREGGASKFPHDSTCQVVCNPGGAKVKG